LPPADLFHLPLTIERKTVTHLASAGRTTAIVRFEGGGAYGLGEEVTFQADDLLQESPRESWPFSGTFGEFSLWLASHELFARPPQYEVVRNYRRWAFEAAALDLALRQADARFDEVVGRAVGPVNFVVSPPRGFTSYPGAARLKIEAADVRPGLPVDVIDFKLELDRAAVMSTFAMYPNAVLEDPTFIPSGAKVSWDIPYTSVELLRRSAPPDALNIKPARFGSVAALIEVYELCAEHAIFTYGGGQHEIGPGRGQIQLLASLFHPIAPNDVAPAGYNEPNPPAGLPTSPLDITPRVGFGL
jgi:hypothetical protein